MRIADNLSNTPVVVLLSVFRIPDQFINKISEMQDKAKPVSFAGALIFKDHAAISVHCSGVSILAAYECETSGSRIIICRGRDGAADPATEAFSVGKAVPVNVCWFQSSNQYTARPV